MKTTLFTILAVTALISASAQTTPQNLTNGLVAFYPFEGNGNDASGNGNNSTPAGSFQYLATGLTGGAIRINGDNSLFYAGGGHVLLPTFGSDINSDYSFSLWVKDEVIGGWPVGEEAYIAFGSLSLKRAEMWIGSGFGGVKFAFDDSSGTGIETNSTAADLGLTWPTYLSSWKHLVFTYSAGVMSGYVNGQKRVEVSRSYNIFPVATAALGRHWWDGGGSSSARMSCTYDNVRIWNRVLTDQEVRQLNAFDQNLVTLGISIKTLRLTMNVELGKTYQIESSTNLPNWSDYGPPFVASTTPIYEDVDVVDGYRYFRLKIIP